MNKYLRMNIVGLRIHWAEWTKRMKCKNGGMFLLTQETSKDTNILNKLQKEPIYAKKYV